MLDSRMTMLMSQHAESSNLLASEASGKTNPMVSEAAQGE